MSNHLAGSTSPYLEQHADNPVDWRPWGEPALTLAREQNKPIFLSIGYSACHWCHVMAHESFEDDFTAQAINRDFIPIKVDREERPDLDQIYQQAHQILTRRGGGWPLSIFLTPDLKPFFAGTYFPKTRRYGMPSFTEVLAAVVEAWRERPEAVGTQAGQVTDLLTRYQNPGADMGGQDDPLPGMGGRLLVQHDDRFGGFGSAPKFPHVPDLRLLLRLTSRTGDPRFAQAAAFTLDAMIAGGIHDQIGGGFARYSVDDRWLVPHFEKMGYDNGQLLLVLSEADALLGVDEERRRARWEIVAWLQREMLLPGGGFAAALDADSEGEEGRFYVWQQGELAGLLNPEDFELVSAAWGVSEQGNFEDKNILIRALNPQALRERFGQGASVRLAAIAQRLREHRDQRVHPGLDDKLLTAWNALLVKGLLRHAALEGDETAQQMAITALDAVLALMWDGDQLWTAARGERHSDAPGFLDDYAFLSDALIEAHTWSGKSLYLEIAHALTERVLARFSAPQGGFYFTGLGQADVIVRTQNPFDAATPSGNGVAATVLLRLHALTGEERYRTAAEATLAAFAGTLASSHGGHGALALALDLAQSGVDELTVAGEAPPFLHVLGRHYGAEAVVRRDPAKSGASWCSGGRCWPEVGDAEGLAGQMGGASVRPSTS
ncbi:MAG: thioredoxin domain-containing protein [Alphaproteobacteria bacterium CG_4_10_14_0_2_um_filter_63_37]|nr:MAG: hypothetical protein AUJ55_08890 [Proteobacteria bacterium CG1_02_64_396]PJA24830.1 MAG: thioredoxin domain-containing protein [Alphaproteobacteria bacterium CG_4_10_14_0_2_um_filter_63_37]